MRACVGCGCTDLAACDPPCWWVDTDPPLCSTCAEDPGTLRGDLLDAAQGMAPVVLLLGQTLAGPVWDYIRDRQLIRLRRRYRPAAVRVLDLVWAADPRRTTSCPRRCSEGHTYVWPCGMAPALPAGDADPYEGAAESDLAPDWWEHRP